MARVFIYITGHSSVQKESVVLPSNSAASWSAVILERRQGGDASGSILCTTSQGQDIHVGECLLSILGIQSVPAFGIRLDDTLIERPSGAVLLSACIVLGECHPIDRGLFSYGIQKARLSFQVSRLEGATAGQPPPFELQADQFNGVVFMHRGFDLLAVQVTLKLLRVQLQGFVLGPIDVGRASRRC